MQASWAAAFLLLCDSVAAIGFAAGIAWAVTASNSESRQITPAIALLLVSGLARGLFAMTAARAGARAARTSKLTVQARVIETILQRSTSGSATPGTMIASAVDEVETIDGFVSRYLPARRAAVIAPLMIVVATALASPIAAGILIATLIPFAIVLGLAGGAAADQSRRQFEALSRLSGLFADQIKSLPVILAFRAGEGETERLARAAAEVARRTLGVLRVAFISSAALEFFSALSIALVAVYAGFNLLGLLPFHVSETLDLPRAFFVLALAPEFYAPMRRLAAAYHERQAAETAAERIEAPCAGERETPIARDLSEPPTIRFEAVAVRYPDAVRDAVAQVSFEVAAGQSLAILGPSGSGKSSLLRALVGLAPISDGNISANGVALMPRESLARSCAWSGQSPLILPTTIAANIALATPDAPPAEIEAAAHAAGLGPMLARRNRGLETMLDPRGGGLSGGELRRIGLARAMLKRAPLVLLDEPTAHLDALAEDALIATISAAIAGRTAIIATHSERLASIANTVLRLDARI